MHDDHHGDIITMWMNGWSALQVVRAGNALSP